jgi:predicted metal-binding protein
MDINVVYQIGFCNVSSVKTEDVVFNAELTELCKQNACGSYGRNYMCPPHCGEINGLIEKARAYERLIVFQKIYPLKDSFDFEGMADAGADFGRLVVRLGETVKAEIKKDEFLLLGAGGCRLCEVCGVVDGVPCRNPDRVYSSLEAYGIFVSILAKRCGMKYINGENTVTYFGGLFL